jgi:stearoyl-CoA 9-desaturase NADPH oxidoreductase
MHAVGISSPFGFARTISNLPGALWTHAVRRSVPLLDRASARIELDLPLLEAALGKLDGTLSLRRIRARVLDVRNETHDVKTFVLRPNARFPAYRAGSFVTLQLPIEGRVLQRSYSLSSAPSEPGSIAFTVKRVPGGLVSNWISDHVRVGDVLSLSAPAGRFVLPRELPPKLVMISAGSGITPVMSMLRQLLAERAATQIVFLHFARTPRDLIFHDELVRLASDQPNVQLAFCVERADESWTAARGRFSLELLASVAPEFRELPIYLCGPSGFMRGVTQALAQAEADLSKLRYERFNADFDVSQLLGGKQLVRFVRSQAESISSGPRTILEEAESLGVPVESGCRAGNCGTCRCLKRSGVVVDAITGRASSSAEEFIYPCISIARGTVEVDL